jgi:hypothetical protein
MLYPYRIVGGYKLLPISIFTGIKLYPRMPVGYVCPLGTLRVDQIVYKVFILLLLSIENLIKKIN